MLYFSTTILAVIILAAAGYLASEMMNFPDMAFCGAIGWALAVVCYQCGYEVRYNSRHGTKVDEHGKDRK
jgi:hypothetical protein